jgi:cobalt/nickel transport protein
MMKRSHLQRGLSRILLGLALTSAAGAQAHFQALIPSPDILNADTGNRVVLDLRFTHPMEGGPLMDMAEPVRMWVLGPQGREDLKLSLRAVEVAGKRTYRLDYQVRQPGDYVFYVEPAPYWEPAEGVMIVHHTKVVVDGFGAEEGWDADLGLPVEIEPLVRPYGLWAGNLFSGVVKQAGKPVPFAEVEVEWRNDGSLTPPFDSYVTQVIKADGNGVFSYAMPRAGWWGFAALLEGDQPMTNPEGEEVPVELGALIWVYTRDMR